MSIDNQDFELKSVRGYKDPKTRVYIGGREKLAGRDWRKRKEELAQRSGGRCERIFLGSLTNRRCGQEARDPHHVVLRSKEREDRIMNLLHVCGDCHRELDGQQREAIRARNREKYTFRIVDSAVDGGKI